jgi:hypothetical protein
MLRGEQKAPVYWVTEQSLQRVQVPAQKQLVPDQARRGGSEKLLSYSVVEWMLERLGISGEKARGSRKDRLE